MQTIQNNIENEIIIKNSKFIALLFPITSEEEVSKIIHNLKNEYKNATHYCYAYTISEIKRFNDDNEPTGTAGMPILNVLVKTNLSNVLCVVVRYFGGIKLGAGGLIRAYGKAVREALNLATLININEAYKVMLSFKYDDMKKIDFIINKIPIIKKEFNEEIKYTIMLKKDELDLIDQLKLSNVSIIEIKKDYFLE